MKKWTPRLLIVELLMLAGAWLLGVYLYKGFTRCVDRSPLSPVEWTVSVLLFAGIWLAVRTLQRPRPKRLTAVIAILVAGSAVLYILAEPSVSWERFENRMGHCFDRDPDFKIIEIGMAEHTIQDVPVWVSRHPMRWYYREILWVVGGFPNCSKSYTVSKGAERFRCTVHYIDGRACVLVLEYEPTSSVDAERIRRDGRREFGRLPIKMMAEKGIIVSVETNGFTTVRVIP